LKIIIQIEAVIKAFANIRWDYRIVGCLTVKGDRSLKGIDDDTTLLTIRGMPFDLPTDFILQVAINIIG